ncbi:MAG: twin-arginine translocase subunit TatC, partial [Lentisphaeria bacterium]|nr:twin-arginine translocase subunit TatC [Lentisphaeria bacterium]
LAFGLVFQVPLILFVLGWLGVISSNSLRSWRRFAIVLAFFLGMVLTPPDPMSQLLMAIPLILLYELSIWGVYFKEVCSGEHAKGGDGAAQEGKGESA